MSGTAAWGPATGNGSRWLTKVVVRHAMKPWRSRGTESHLQQFILDEWDYSKVHEIRRLGMLLEMEQVLLV